VYNASAEQLLVPFYSKKEMNAMTMVVEGFELTDTVAEEAAHFLTQVHQTRRDHQAEALGLYRPHVTSVKTARDLYGDRMTDDELRTWKAFLPNRFSRQRGQWTQIDPALLPDEVMDKVERAHSLDVFDDLQIWSAKPQDVDPMAVGVVYGESRNHYFKVVRWGEALAPFETIKETLEQRSSFVARRTLAVLIVVALVVLTGTSLLVALHPSGGLASPIMSSVAGFVWAVIFLGGAQIDHRRRMAAERFPVEATTTLEGVATATG
jgi:hypothetical protein